MFTYILKNRLLNTRFYNKLTNEHVETSYVIIIKYAISKNYIFFASNVLLLTIGITLLVFVAYHFNLLRLNVTTNEKIKRDKMIKYMIIIKDTMRNLYLSGEFKDADNTKKRNFIEEYAKESSLINLTKEHEKKYDDIVFNSRFLFFFLIFQKNIFYLINKIVFIDPTFDLKMLNREEVFKFAKFADERLKAFKNNYYYTGFLENLKLIFYVN